MLGKLFSCATDTGVLDEVGERASRRRRRTSPNQLTAGQKKIEEEFLEQERREEAREKAEQNKWLAEERRKERERKKALDYLSTEEMQKNCDRSIKTTDEKKRERLVERETVSSDIVLQKNKIQKLLMESFRRKHEKSEPYNAKKALQSLDRDTKADYLLAVNELKTLQQYRDKLDESIRTMNKNISNQKLQKHQADMINIMNESNSVVPKEIMKKYAETNQELMEEMTGKMRDVKIINEDTGAAMHNDSDEEDLEQELEALGISDELTELQNPSELTGPSLQTFPDVPQHDLPSKEESPDDQAEMLAAF